MREVTKQLKCAVRCKELIANSYLRVNKLGLKEQNHKVPINGF